jgi:hypothetical protein
MNCFLRAYNEVFSSEDKTGNISRKEWLKDAITSRKQTIELKGKDAFETDNFMNFILFSNNESPILLDKRDRRFNVIRNLTAKKVSALSFYRGQEFLESDLVKELDTFAEIIFSLKYDIEKVNQTIDSDAKKNIIALAVDAYEDFIQALRAGNGEYFLFDEIFKPSFQDTILNKNAISQEALEAEKMVKDHNAIPAKFMKNVVKYHFDRDTYKKSLEKLKRKGLINKDLRIPGDVFKAYV